MNKNTEIEVFFLVLSLIMIFYFITSTFIAFILNNWDLGIISLVIFLSGAGLLFFFAQVFESLQQNKK